MVSKKAYRWPRCRTPWTLAQDPRIKFVLSGIQAGYPRDRHFGFTCRPLTQVASYCRSITGPSNHVGHVDPLSIRPVGFTYIPNSCRGLSRDYDGGFEPRGCGIQKCPRSFAPFWIHIVSQGQHKDIKVSWWSRSRQRTMHHQPSFVHALQPA